MHRHLHENSYVRYYSEPVHGAIEDLWDNACTPAAVVENIVIAVVAATDFFQSLSFTKFLGLTGSVIDAENIQE